jgi:hypothetical protein
MKPSFFILLNRRKKRLNRPLKSRSFRQICSRVAQARGNSSDKNLPRQLYFTPAAAIT